MRFSNLFLLLFASRHWYSWNFFFMNHISMLPRNYSDDGLRRYRYRRQAFIWSCRDVSPIWGGRSGEHPNTEMRCYQYRNYHFKYQTISRPSYFQKWKSLYLERHSLYWDGTQIGIGSSVQTKRPNILENLSAKYHTTFCREERENHWSYSNTKLYAIITIAFHAFLGLRRVKFIKVIKIMMQFVTCHMTTVIIIIALCLCGYNGRIWNQSCN